MRAAGERLVARLRRGRRWRRRAQRSRSPARASTMPPGSTIWLRPVNGTGRPGASRCRCGSRSRCTRDSRARACASLPARSAKTRFEGCAITSAPSSASTRAVSGKRQSKQISMPTRAGPTRCTASGDVAGGEPLLLALEEVELAVDGLHAARARRASRCCRSARDGARRIPRRSGGASRAPRRRARVPSARSARPRRARDLGVRGEDVARRPQLGDARRDRLRRRRRARGRARGSRRSRPKRGAPWTKATRKSDMRRR